MKDHGEGKVRAVAAVEISTLGCTPNRASKLVPTQGAP